MAGIHFNTRAAQGVSTAATICCLDVTLALLRLVLLPSSVQSNPMIPVAPARPAAIRRRLALVARFRERHHQRSFFASALGITPLMPLMLSPFPNIPLYYVGYRVFSHRNAWRGAQTLHRVLAQHAAAQHSTQQVPPVRTAQRANCSQAQDIAGLVHLVLYSRTRCTSYVPGTHVLSATERDDLEISVASHGHSGPWHAYVRGGRLPSLLCAQRGAQDQSGRDT
jgi:Mitochondrial K+-H+ exchange-related